VSERTEHEPTVLSKSAHPRQGHDGPTAGPVAAPACIFRFGRFELDPARCELRGEGLVLKVEPKAFDFLTYLIVHRYRVVTKSELLCCLWPGETVSPGAITQCAFTARKAIGDSGAEQQMIRTVSKRGYQFVAEVEEAVARGVRGISSSQQQPSHAPAGRRARE
jgi:DNA-binding winged helix-turn-helix (wHTH) protein